MLAVTITNLRYVDVIVYNEITPLGDNGESSTISDSIVATFNVENTDLQKVLITDHEVWFRPEAIGNRIVNYDPVIEYIHAVEALVREVVFGWSPTLKPVDPDDPVHVNGGIDSRITVEWADGVDTSVLEDHTERIDSAITAFSVQEDGEEND